jgi:hypothetical protein
MIYTKSNELQTRIALKYDSYENWTTNNPVLLAGELAIATIPAETSVPTKSPREMQDLPNVVMKVGDGSSHYNDLKFVSALAADVYDWAKAATRPTYTANDIVDLDKFVEDHSDYDTNTQYTIETVADTNGYKFELKYKDIGDESFKSFNTPVYMDLTGADTRLKKLEKDIADLLGGEGEGAVGGIQELINNSIANLDSEAEQVAGADGLALKVVMEDGALKSISGSIAANTYDAHGAAKAVQGETASTVKDAMDAAATAKNAADAAQKAADDEKAAREAAIQALDYNGYEAGVAEGTTISFVGTVSETDGIITAEKRDLVFQSAYNAETNKAATMADVTGAVADLNGAMHFEGVSTTDPVNDKVTIEGKEDYVAAAGDVVIYNTIEYVYDGNKWIQLGDETMAGTLIAGLDVDDIAVGADSTLSVIGETDGLIHVTPVKIQIAQNQVTDLEGRLEDIEAEFNVENADSLAKKVADNTAAIATIQGEDTDKSMRTVAADEAAKAVGALDLADEAVEGKYVAAVKQADGQIEVVRADLPVIPSLELVEGTATTPKAETVAVVADIDVDGHKITDTRVNVATMAGVVAELAKLDADKDVSTAKHVVTGVTQVDGLITSIDEVPLAEVAFSGNIADLKETANTYVVFNCGSSSVNI